jgi:hypothetical protein
MTRIKTSGEISVIDEFLDEVRFKGIQKGAAIDEIEKKEITSEVYLPQRFLRLYTDELTDIGRKLDKGNDFLGEITRNTSELTRSNSELIRNTSELTRGNSELIRNTSELPEIKSVLGLGDQREHNKRLEKILEKLAEKDSGKNSHENS